MRVQKFSTVCPHSSVIYYLVANMDGQEEVVLCGAACVVVCTLLKKKRRAKPKCWVRPFLRRREEETENFLEDLKIDPEWI